jgi:hypothetical protein
VRTEPDSVELTQPHSAFSSPYPSFLHSSPGSLWHVGCVSAAAAAAGTVSGFLEALLCVVPMTTMQVKFCHDSRRDVPRFTSLPAGIRHILTESGWAGLYQVITGCP